MHFKESLEKGQSGEVKVIYHLKEKGIEVNDYTNYELHKYKQEKGYDIEIKNPETNEWDRVDIKSNAKNGFVYLEATQHQNLGWFWTSSSDLIYHYDIKEDIIYSYDLKKMRNFVYRNDIKPKYGRYKNLIGLKTDEIKLIKQI